jgi:hypothetical protein
VEVRDLAMTSAGVFSAAIRSNSGCSGAAPAAFDGASSIPLA